MAQDLKTILFNWTKTSREEIRDFGDNSAIGQAAARNWWVYEKMLTAAGMMAEYEAWEKGGPVTEEDWDNQPKSITMTNAQWHRLVFYILTSTKYREGERDAWAKLAEEKNPDGSPVFKHAASNAEYWQEVCEELEIIKAIIDN